jgi:hypothetical protein
MQFLHSFDYVAQIIVWRLRTDRVIDAGLWREITLDTLARAASSGRDAETLWALWFLKELGIKVPSTAYKTITDYNGPLVLAALPHFMINGLLDLPGHHLNNLWDVADRRRPISGHAWPLALELHHCDVHKPAWLNLDGHDTFKSIFDAKCSLFDWDRAPSVFLDDDDELEERPRWALGELGSDYDDEDVDEEANLGEGTDF